jgi:hypothetical protein
MSDGDAGVGTPEEVAVLIARGQSVLGGDVPNWQKRSVERSLASRPPASTTPPKPSTAA